MTISGSIVAHALGSQDVVARLLMPRSSRRRVRRQSHRFRRLAAAEVLPAAEQRRAVGEASVAPWRSLGHLLRPRKERPPPRAAPVRRGSALRACAATAPSAWRSHSSSLAPSGRAKGPSRGREHERRARRRHHSGPGRVVRWRSNSGRGASQSHRRANEDLTRFSPLRLGSSRISVAQTRPMGFDDAAIAADRRRVAMTAMIRRPRARAQHGTATPRREVQGSDLARTRGESERGATGTGTRSHDDDAIARAEIATGTGIATGTRIDDRDRARARVGIGAGRRDRKRSRRASRALGARRADSMRRGPTGEVERRRLLPARTPTTGPREGAAQAQRLRHRHPGHLRALQKKLLEEQQRRRAQPGCSRNPGAAATAAGARRRRSSARSTWVT